MTKKGKGRKAAEQRSRDDAKGKEIGILQASLSAAQKEGTEEENKCARRHPSERARMFVGGSKEKQPSKWSV